MTLSGGEYAIHGTNKPELIGTFASYGCIPTLNEDITDLYRARERRHAGRGAALAVEPQQVVLGKSEAADGRF